MASKHVKDHNIPPVFRRNHPGRWLPDDYRVQREWLRRRIEHVDNNPRQELIPALQEFQQMVETTPRIYMCFSKMWDEVPRTRFYQNDPTGTRQIRDYLHMLDVLNHCFTTAPEWTDAAESVGMVGVPLCAVFDYAMATPSGHAAFLDPDVNAMLKKVLNAWGKFLQTPASTVVLGRHPNGWFSEDGYRRLMEVANAPYQTSYEFEDVFVCDPSAPHYGFRSWDDFFTRRLQPQARPVASPEDDSIVVNACESRTFAVVLGANLRDKFWIKGQPYSVLDMLAHDPLAHYFAGATVYQAFLSALSYHRWHAPLSGTIVRAFVQDGTYFSEPLFEGIADTGSDGDGDENDDTKVINPKGITVAQGYLTALATRAIIFIEADNPDIGLMAFIGVGMDEVSTCDIIVQEGEHVIKGDELGMFHFGGSSHVLLFRRDVAISGFPVPGGEVNVPIRGKLAKV